MDEKIVQAPRVSHHIHSCVLFFLTNIRHRRTESINWLALKWMFRNAANSVCTLFQFNLRFFEEILRIGFLLAKKSVSIFILTSLTPFFFTKFFFPFFSTVILQKSPNGEWNISLTFYLRGKRKKRRKFGRLNWGSRKEIWMHQSRCFEWIQLSTSRVKKPKRRGNRQRIFCEIPQPNSFYFTHTQ